MSANLKVVNDHLDESSEVKDEKLEALHKDPVIKDLLEVTLFESLKDCAEGLKDLREIFFEKVYEANSRVVNEGEMSDELYILTKGSVCIMKKTVKGDEYKVVSLYAEDDPFFGEMALLTADQRSVSIIAENEVTCLVTTQKEFQVFADKHPKHGMEILKAIAIRMSGYLRRANADNAVLYQALVQEVSKSTEIEQE
jgi:CRP-like cAMP-binding protein